MSRGEFYSQLIAAGVKDTVVDPTRRRERWTLKLRCPRCESDNIKVYDTRQHKTGRIRKRQCENCLYRWDTIEISLITYEEHLAGRSFMETKHV